MLMGVRQHQRRAQGHLGHVQDDESGLVYMRARYYEPGTGRFLNEDPEAKGINWLAYCDNQPITEVDATGRSGILEFLVHGSEILVMLYGAYTMGDWSYHHPSQGSLGKAAGAIAMLCSVTEL